MTDIKTASGYFSQKTFLNRPRFRLYHTTNVDREVSSLLYFFLKKIVYFIEVGLADYYYANHLDIDNTVEVGLPYTKTFSMASKM